MSNAKLKGFLITYAFALVATGAGFFLRIVVTHFTGPSLATYITFYPFVMFAAVLGGLGPGLLTTVTSAFIVDYWVLLPQGIFSYHNLADAVGMALFIIMGVLISVVVEFYHRRQEKQIKELRLAEIYNRSLLEASLDPLVTISREGKITDANEAAAKIRGIPREKIIGTDFSRYFTEPEKAEEGYQQVFIKGFVSNYPLIIKRADGKLTNVLYNATVYKDNGGNVLGVFAAARDITELKKSEQKLKESYSNLEQRVRGRTQDLENSQIAIQNVLEDLRVEKENLDHAKAKDEAILESIGDAVIACDKNGKIILFNSVAEDLTGFSLKEVIGKDYHNYLNFLMEDTGTPIKDFITETLKTGRHSKMANHTLLMKKDGRKISITTSASPIKDAEGNLVGCVVVFRDTTAERELEKAKDEFVSLASHQLKTPATGVKAFLSMLLDEDAGKLNSQQREFIAKAYQGNERELKIIENLLNVARVETGRLIIDKKEIDLSGWITEMVTQYAGAIKLRGQTIKFVKPTSPVKVSVDTEKLWMAVSNLIDNASKYTREGGHIEISLKEGPKKTYISVKDSGIGIAKKDFDKLFKKISRLDSAMTNSVSGTGLGLYLVKRIVELHNGSISVNSTLGKGSEFMIELPKGVSTNEQSFDN